MRYLRNDKYLSKDMRFIELIRNFENGIKHTFVTELFVIGNKQINNE